MVELTDVSGPELAELLATVLGSAAVTLAGLGIELAGLANVLAGQLTIGAWEVVIGFIALYVGVYLLAYQRALPKLQAGSGQGA